SATLAPATKYRAAPQDFPGDSPHPRRAGILRNRDAHAHALDAGRRARLPGAQPDPSRAVLRPAAIAADVQAAADDRRAGPLFSAGALLSRRRLARRSPAGIHAARSGDVLP